MPELQVTFLGQRAGQPSTDRATAAWAASIEWQCEMRGKVSSSSSPRDAHSSHHLLIRTIYTPKPTTLETEDTSGSTWRVKVLKVFILIITVITRLVYRTQSYGHRTPGRYVPGKKKKHKEKLRAVAAHRTGQTGYGARCPGWEGPGGTNEREGNVS